MPKCIWHCILGIKRFKYCEQECIGKYCAEHKKWGDQFDKLVCPGYLEFQRGLQMCDTMEADPKLQEKFNQTHEDYEYSPRSNSIKIFNFEDVEYGEGLMYDYEEERFDRIMREKIVVDYFDCKYDNQTGIITIDDKLYKLEFAHSNGEKYPWPRQSTEKEILRNITIDYEDHVYGKIIYMKSGIIRFMVGNPAYPIDTSIVFREIK